LGSATPLGMLALLSVESRMFLRSGPGSREMEIVHGVGAAIISHNSRHVRAAMQEVQELTELDTAPDTAELQRDSGKYGIEVAVTHGSLDRVCPAKLAIPALQLAGYTGPSKTVAATHIDGMVGNRLAEIYTR
jgi:hypothetical protein